MGHLEIGATGASFQQNQAYSFNVAQRYEAQFFNVFGALESLTIKKESCQARVLSEAGQLLLEYNIPGRVENLANAGHSGS